MKKINLHTIFFNNKFLLAFSFIIAFVSWVIFTWVSPDTQSKSINDLPIEIKLSDAAKSDALKVFNGADTKVSVKVKSNNRMVLSSITASDIKVEAKQSEQMITSPGNYILELSVEKTDESKNFTIESVEPKIVTVFVDREKNMEFNVQPDLKYNIDKSQYISEEPRLSVPTVKISGPATKMNKISKAVVKKSFNEILKETQNFVLSILLYDDNDEMVSQDQLNMSAMQEYVTLPILYKKTLSVKPSCTNFPEGFNMSSMLTLDKDKLEIAGPESVMSQLTEVYLEDLDSSEVNSTNGAFAKNLKLPDGCKCLSNVSTVNVKMRTSDLSEKIFNVGKIDLINMSNKFNASVSTQSASVTLVGPSSALKKVTDADVLLQVDMSKVTEAGEVELPAKVQISADKGCWSFGKYSVKVYITKK